MARTSPMRNVLRAPRALTYAQSSPSASPYSRVFIVEVGFPETGPPTPDTYDPERDQRVCSASTSTFVQAYVGRLTNAASQTPEPSGRITLSNQGSF